MTLAHLQDRFSGPGFDLNRLDTRPASHALHRSDAEGSVHAAILSGIVQERAGGSCWRISSHHWTKSQAIIQATKIEIAILHQNLKPTLQGDKGPAKSQ